MPTDVKPAMQGGFDHVAGQARVLADHHAVAVVAALEQEARRLPHLQGQFRRDDAVGAAADSVGAEMLACHADPAVVVAIEVVTDLVRIR